MIEYISIIIGVCITGVTSQIPNNILPMLFQSTESQIAIFYGFVPCGYPFPFVVGIGSFDWIGLIVDVAIFSIIIYVVLGSLSSIKKRVTKG